MGDSGRRKSFLWLGLEPLQHPMSRVRRLPRIGQHAGRAVHLAYALRQLVQEGEEVRHVEGHEVLYEPQAHLHALDLVAAERDLAVDQRLGLGVGLLLRVPAAGGGGVPGEEGGRGHGCGGRGCRGGLGVGGGRRPDLVLVHQHAAAQVVADVSQLLGDGGE